MSLNPPPQKKPETEREWRGFLRSIYQIFDLIGRIHTGSGTPEGAVKAPVGHIYLRDDGGANTTLYVKEANTDNTGWSAK